MEGAGLSVEGAGSRVQGVGFRVQGLGLRVQGAGCRVGPPPSPPAAQPATPSPPAQGYLAHEKHPPPRTLQWDYTKGPVMVLGGGAVSYELRTSVVRST